MEKTHPKENQPQTNNYPAALSRPRPRDETGLASKTEGYRGYIARWRRAILRTAAVLPAVKRTLHELSDYELATYLAVKCRGGKLDQPADVI